MMQINLVDCTRVILDEVAGGLSRNSVALSYAMAMKSEAQQADTPDWKAINTAIINRWGLSGLKAVKNRAWGIAEGRITIEPKRDT